MHLSKTSTKCISSSCRFLLKILAKGRLSRKRKRLVNCQMKSLTAWKGASDYKINCHFNLCGRLRTKSKSKALSRSYAMSPCPSFLSATHSERNRKMIKNRRAWSWSTEKKGKEVKKALPVLWAWMFRRKRTMKITKEWSHNCPIAPVKVVKVTINAL